MAHFSEEGIELGDRVSIPRVEVFPGRLRVLVRVAEGTPRFTDEALIARAVEAYPTLLRHSCINAKGPTFGDVAVGTSVPHLLEHLVIAEQVALAGRRGKRASFVGTTEWVRSASEGEPREAIVEVSFIDDLEALEALSRALAFLNAPCAKGSDPLSHGPFYGETFTK